MARFLTRLVASKVAEARGPFGRATWILEAPMIFYSDVAHRAIAVPVGFTTDFASVPRLPLAFTIAGDIGHKSATVHDYLCRTRIMTRALADKVFREALEVEGVPAWRRAIMYAGVRVGSWFDGRK